MDVLFKAYIHHGNILGEINKINHEHGIAVSRSKESYHSAKYNNGLQNVGKK
jgi:hypothetical protein